MKKHISLKSYILITTLVLVFFSLVVVFFASYTLVKERLTQNMLRNLTRETDAIALYIEAEDSGSYMSGLASDEMVERTGYMAEEAANRYDGRIMLISRDYRILKDTFNQNEDSYIINKHVMSVMTGERSDYVRRSRTGIEIIRQVKRNKEVIGAIVSTATLESTYKGQFRQFMLILAVILIVFAVDILLILRLTRRSVSDMENINEQMVHIVQGNLQERIGQQRFAETQEFADSFNEVLSRLSTIDQTRSEFVSNVSHELKTPITSMKVLAESIVENEGADVDDYKEFMTDIIDEIDRETKIINDLLTLVRTDTQNTKLNIESKNINEMMNTIIKTVMPLAKQRNISLTYEDYRDIEAEVDEVKLTLAISNLIENGVKYNVDNGWIKCSLNADNKYFYIKVADSGVGIPEDAKDRVFERFYRVDKARSRDTGGTGLGLAITRNIINAHRGTIKLYSESGKGTTFTVRIPLIQNKKKDAKDITKEIPKQIIKEVADNTDASKNKEQTEKTG